MDVMIVETKTGKAVATVPVVLKGLNYTPSEEEYFSASWECAVEDGAVDPKQRASYTIKLVSSAKVD